MPNPGHATLARFERRWPDFVVITQNVDGLHHRAGNGRVIELHGNIWRARCTAGCGRVIDQSPPAEPWRAEDTADPSEAPVPRCTCGAPLRPDVVWFGETLNADDLDRAFDAATKCQVLLVVGTSSLVYPAAGIPQVARRAGAMVVEINPEPTPLTPLAQIALAAVEAGQFHIYPIAHIDEGIEVLTGIPAGVADKRGKYPKGTVNHAVMTRLAQMAKKRQAFEAKGRAQKSSAPADKPEEPTLE
jgi:NAD-dependent deacetylase